MAAIGAITTLKELERRVPEDVAVVGYDNPFGCIAKVAVAAPVDFSGFEQNEGAKFWVGIPNEWRNAPKNGNLTVLALNESRLRLLIVIYFPFLQTTPLQPTP